MNVAENGLDQALWDGLRPFQQQGVTRVVDMLDADAHGSLLCDLMGLGKTFQTLTVIHAFCRAHETNALVVVPSAQIAAQWEKETKIRLAARMSCILLLDGAAVDQERAMHTHRAAKVVLVTTSPVIKLAIESFRAIMPEIGLLVVDEAHVLRSAETTLRDALLSLHAPARLLLTATPVQNCLEELWRLYDFAVPGHLGTEVYFLALSARETTIDEKIGRDRPRVGLEGVEIIGRRFC